MNDREKHLIKDYLSNLHVNVTNAGYNNVGQEWRDIDYIPDYNKFYYICEGEGWLKIGEKEYLPKPGQLFLMPQGVKQSYSTISANAFTKYWCHFTASIGSVNILDLIKLPCFIDVGKNEELERAFRELLTYYSSIEPSASLMLKASILRLISFYMDHTAESDINISHSENTEQLNFILHYIEKNISRNITVKELSDMVHLHPNYFIRLFRRHLGTTPIQYINKARMEEAKRLLTATDYTLTEICERVGTANNYYLSKKFKDYTGFSPTVYRHLESNKAKEF